jgi:hypothetical protein
MRKGTFRPQLRLLPKRGVGDLFGCATDVVGQRIVGAGVVRFHQQVLRAAHRSFRDVEVVREVEAGRGIGFDEEERVLREGVALLGDRVGRCGIAAAAGDEGGSGEQEVEELHADKNRRLLQPTFCIHCFTSGSRNSTAIVSTGPIGPTGSVQQDPVE